LKLLFDENLSPKLADSLVDLYPESRHVSQVALAAASDADVWEHAGTHGFTIVTKDDDFRQRSFLLGPPPKVIWVRLGNCRTCDVEHVLRDRFEEVSGFDASREAALMVIVRRVPGL